MSVEEFFGWLEWFAHKAREEKKAMAKAKAKRGGGKGRS